MEGTEVATHVGALRNGTVAARSHSETCSMRAMQPGWHTAAAAHHACSAESTPVPQTWRSMRRSGRGASTQMATRVWVSVATLSIYLSIYLSICLSTYLSIRLKHVLSFPHSVHSSLYISPSLSLSHSLPVYELSLSHAIYL